MNDTEHLKYLINFMIDETPEDAMSVKEREKRRKDLLDRVDTGKIATVEDLEKYIFTEI